jgi:Cys-tRNA(Pro) deacylase
LNETNLVEYLKEKKVWFRIIEKETTVHTADAAAATGIPLERLTKSLVFLDENKNPTLVIVLGTCKVNSEKLKNLLGVKDIKLAPFEEAEKYSSYPPGATPPVAHEKIKRVVIDQRVMVQETVFGGGGSRNKLVEMKPEDIRKLNEALIGDVAEVVR